MLNLNKDYISAANNASQFNAGSYLASEAESVYAEGMIKMWAPFSSAKPNEKQSAILSRREEEWKSLVEKAYNDIISKRAAWIPWTVSGPARYPAKKMNAAADREMNAHNEWHQKMNKFIENTANMLRDAIPQEELLAQYRSGQRRDAISGDDPLAMEKLSARLEGMKERHETHKKINAWWRKHKTMKGCPDISEKQAEKIDNEMKNDQFRFDIPFPAWSLSNSNAEMKRIEERIRNISSQREAGDAKQEYNGFTVEHAGTDGRINITFDSKPEEAARDILKKNGFHWSPRAKVWTRQYTHNAMMTVRHYVVPGLLALDEYSAAEQPEETPAAMTLEEFVTAASAAQ